MIMDGWTLNLIIPEFIYFILEIIKSTFGIFAFNVNEDVAVGFFEEQFYQLIMELLIF